MPTPQLVLMAARFPLMPRSRPPARPLDTRVARLTGLARTAHHENDPTKASTAFNGAALLASDCGAGNLAADWCRWHARLYLDRTRLDATGARFALEPLVNLARLRTRAGDGDSAYQLLAVLDRAVTHQTAAAIDGVEVRTDRWSAEVAHHPELTDWLRRVLLADGTRALVAAERWNEAVDHTRQHGGLTQQLHEGRQVAVLAALIADDTATAVDLVDTCLVAEPWEHAIKDVLLAMSANADPRAEGQQRSLLSHPLHPDLATGNGLTIYRTRLGLTILDLTANTAAASSARQHLCQRLCTDALTDQDGHAVNDLIDHPLVSTTLRGDLRNFLDRCGLNQGDLPAAAHADLQCALTLAAEAIRAPR
jgi:hypothetical protein